MSGLRRFLPNLNKNVWYVLISSAVIGFSIEGGVTTVLFNLLLLRLDYGPEFIGILASVGNTIFGLGAIVGGFICLRWGAQRTMLLGMLIATLGLSLILIAPAFEGSARSALFIGISSLRSTGVTLILVAATPYLIAFTSGSDRNTAFSLDSAAYGIAAFSGAWLGGRIPQFLAGRLGQTLDQPDPYRYAFVVVLMGMVVGIVAVSRMEQAPVDDLPDSSSQRSLLREMSRPLLAAVTIFTLVSFLGGLGMSVTHTFGNVYLDDVLNVPTATIGSFSSAGNLGGVITVLLLPSLLARWTLFRATFFSYLVMGLVVIALAFSNSWQLAATSLMGSIALINMRFTTFRIYSMEPIPVRFQSLVSGILGAGGGLGFGVSAFVGGFLIERIGYNQLFLLGGSLIILTALILGFYELTKQTSSPLAPASSVEKW